MRQITPGKYVVDNSTEIIDHEYIEAYEKSKGEQAYYYEVSYIGSNMKRNSYIKKYKPSIAELFAKRDGKTYTRLDK